MTYEEDELLAVIRNELGSQVRVRPYPRDGDSPIGVALGIAEAELGRPIALFLADGGTPEIFSLPGYNPVVVVLSARYLEFAAIIRENVFRATLAQKELIGEELVTAVTAITLRILAELTLGLGDPALACYLFARSAAGDTYHKYHISYSTIESVTKTRIYAPFWISFLHEIGHAHYVRRPGDSVSPALTADMSKYIDIRLPQIVSAFFSVKPNQDQLALMRSAGIGDVPDEMRQQVIQSDWLRPDLLAEELSADAFAMQALFDAANRLIGPDFPAFDLAGEIIVQSQVSHFLNFCTVTTKSDFGGGSNPPLDPRIILTNEMRNQFLTEMLSRRLAAIEVSRAGLSHSSAESDMERHIFDELVHRHADARELRELIERGRWIAQYEQTDPRQRKIGVYAVIASVLEEPSSVARLREEIKNFTDIARDSSISHPDIDLLRSMADDPSRAQDILKAEVRAYFTALIYTRNIRVPIVIRLPGRDIIFVYCQRATLEIFLRKFRSGIPRDHEEFRVESSSFTSFTKHDMQTVIQGALRNLGYPTVDVVEEGTRQFNTDFPEVLDAQKIEIAFPQAKPLTAPVLLPVIWTSPYHGAVQCP